ncbi:MAG: homoserine kinase [bacterium]
MVKVRVPASTSNLGSGFDCFGLALQLYLVVQMELLPRGLQIVSGGEGSTQIPTKEDNLVFKAAKKLFDYSGKSLPGLRISTKNEIPLFRGLGSSGAATIAGLLGASQLAHAEVSAQEILTLANELEGHPENAAASFSGGLTINCLAQGRVVYKRVEIEPDLKAVLLIPEVSISTERARRVLPPTVEHSAAVFNLQRSALLAHALVTRDYQTLRIAMQDKLHQPFRKSLIPKYDEFEAVGYENGALGVCISGSGSTILGLTQGDGKALQKAWQKKVAALRADARVLVVGIENWGAQVSEE